MRCSTCDMYPTLLEIVGAKVPQQPTLDGISLLPLIEGKASERGVPMGFWDYTAKGISTPSAAWMAELFEAQQAGGDLPPHESSQKAAELPTPAYSTRDFPGHAALIHGDWKLHRIQGKNNKVTWELYDLAKDRGESTDVLEDNGAVVAYLKSELDVWLTSVVDSLNGKDYP